MSSINDVGAGSVGIRARIDNAAWIHSPGFDFLLLIAAPLVTKDLKIRAYAHVKTIW